MENENDWNEALSQQENDRQAADDAEQKRYGEQVMSDFDNLVAKGNQRRAESRRMKDATLSAMILQARNGNGYVPPDVLDAASENMGFRVAGGNFDKKGNFILYGLQQGEDGSAQMAPVAIASPGMQLQTLSRAKMGMEYQREIYEGLSRRYTPEQLEKRGYANPDSPQVVGSTTMSGSAARRLFSMGGPERRGVSSFSADGKGGFSRTHTGPDGVTTREDFGTRDPNYKGEWRVLSKGPSEDSEIEHDEVVTDENGNPVLNDKGEKVTRRVKGNRSQVTRYENSKTGEVVSVKDGETPPWERQATSEKERIAKMNNDSREAIQKSRSQTARDVANASAQATKEKAQKAYETAAARLDAAKSKKQALSASDLRVLSDIGKNYALPEEARNAAVDKLVSLLSDKEKPAPSDGDEKKGGAGSGSKNTGSGGKTSSDGGTEKKVSYNDLKPGQTFVAKGKDGQRHRFRKTQKGYERID